MVRGTIETHAARALHTDCIATAIAPLAKFPSISPDEVWILTNITITWLENTPPTVTQMMRLEAAWSDSSIKRRLRSLRSKGFLSIISISENRRNRYLEPTALALEYLRELDAAMGRLLSCNRLRMLRRQHRQARA